MKAFIVILAVPHPPVKENRGGNQDGVGQSGLKAKAHKGKRF